MSLLKQLKTLEKNISNIQDPALLFVMNQKARELETKINMLNNTKLLTI